MYLMPTVTCGHLHLLLIGARNSISSQLQATLGAPPAGASSMKGPPELARWAQVACRCARGVRCQVENRTRHSLAGERQPHAAVSLSGHNFPGPFQTQPLPSLC